MSTMSVQHRIDGGDWTWGEAVVPDDGVPHSVETREIVMPVDSSPHWSVGHPFWETKQPKKPAGKIAGKRADLMIYDEHILLGEN